MTGPLSPRALLGRLVDADIRFVLVGGLAVNAWGHVRSTQDVDIVPDPDPGNLDRLATLLESLDGRAGDRTLVATEVGPVDVLQGLAQIPPFAELDRDAVDVDVEGLRLRVCSLDALLAMKRASDRPRDREDLEILEATREDSS